MNILKRRKNAFSYDDGVGSLINRTITKANFQGTTIGANAFRGCTQLESILMPNVSSVGVYAFSGCSKLKELVFENKVTLDGYSLSGISSATKIIIKNGVTRLTTQGSGYVFRGCSAGNLIYFGSLPGQAFRASSIKAIDIVTASSLPAYCFYQNTTCDTVVLRNTNLITCGAASSLYSSSGVYNSKINFFVPSNLVDDYKAASIWTNVADRIFPIEGSQYEHYYVDGSPIE